jgi:hypothetical protein
MLFSIIDLFKLSSDTLFEMSLNNSWKTVLAVSSTPKFVGMRISVMESVSLNRQYLRLTTVILGKLTADAYE